MNHSPERTQFLTDVLTTAIEGGINYWATVLDYSIDFSGATALIAETEYLHTEDEVRFELTLDKIATGISRAREGKLGSSSGPDYVAQFWLAERTNGADGDYDAEIADQIVQYALLERVTYG